MYENHFREHKVVLSSLLLNQDETLLESSTAANDVENQNSEDDPRFPMCFWLSNGIWKNWEWRKVYTFYRILFYLLVALEVPCIVVMSLYLIIAPVYCLTVGGEFLLRM